MGCSEESILAMVYGSVHVAVIVLWYGKVTSSGRRGRVREWEGDGVG